MIANAVMLLEPDRIKTQLFPIHGLFESLSKIRAAFGSDESKFRSIIPNL